MKTTEPNIHTVSPVQPFSAQKQCGVWQFCYDMGLGVVEQCDGCGRYRVNENMDVEDD